MHQLETLLIVLHENQCENTLFQGSSELLSREELWGRDCIAYHTYAEATHALHEYLITYPHYAPSCDCIWLAICKVLYSLTNKNAFFLLHFALNCIFSALCYLKASFLLANENGKFFPCRLVVSKVCLKYNRLCLDLQHLESFINFIRA